MLILCVIALSALFVMSAVRYVMLTYRALRTGRLSNLSRIKTVDKCSKSTTSVIVINYKILKGCATLVLFGPIHQMTHFSWLHNVLISLYINKNPLKLNFGIGSEALVVHVIYQFHIPPMK